MLLSQKFPWEIIYIRSRFEKAIAKRLTEKGFEVYFPLVKQLKKWSDRKKLSISLFFLYE